MSQKVSPKDRVSRQLNQTSTNALEQLNKKSRKISKFLIDFAFN